jgi:hypothetical protein
MDASRLADALQIWHPRLLTIAAPATDAVVGSAWTRKQVMGHLIDSAANNHQRFIRLQSGDLSGFPPYDPDIWVERGAYTGNSWTNVVTLWHLYNVQLVHVITGIRADALTNRWTDKNVDLAFLVHDYVDHMVGHLHQIA